MILESVLVAAMLWLTVLVVFGVLPWTTQLVAIYAIHGLRDRMFKIYRTFPAAGRSVLYRDLDALLAVSLHVVRDHSYRDCATLLGGRETAHAPTWRRRRYQWEESNLYSDERGREALGDMMAIVTNLRVFLAMRMVTGHPAILMLAFVSFPFAFARFALSTATIGIKRVDAIESAVARIEEPPAGSGLQALRQLFRGPDMRATA